MTGAGTGGRRLHVCRLNVRRLRVAG